MRIEVLNGVNLDLLGKRDPETYGSATLQDLETRIYQWARELELQVRCSQTNHEGEFIDFCHQALENADGIIVNPGAWTHYAWSIRDALEPFEGPIVEVHISNVDQREPWRHHSVLADVRTDRIVGQGVDGYREALRIMSAKRGEA